MFWIRVRFILILTPKRNVATCFKIGRTYFIKQNAIPALFTKPSIDETGNMSAIFISIYCQRFTLHWRLLKNSHLYGCSHLDNMYYINLPTKRNQNICVKNLKTRKVWCAYAWTKIHVVTTFRWLKNITNLDRSGHIKAEINTTCNTHTAFLWLHL